jgi:hypothetical protein
VRKSFFAKILKKEKHSKHIYDIHTHTARRRPQRAASDSRAQAATATGHRLTGASHGYNFHTRHLSPS